ncbi:MAG: rod shape-determining protein [Clostridia bacterium]|nr:rod shape-determining protein [Clostridiales bacterium]MDD7307484.1 rod shape-determining protein [Eubacteriales bacterium]MDO4351841.1 rod shape-determining protein [Clostridia bacterium]MDY2933228.1 rod shape-determining protein [Anaerovoracaceae bacterium]
MGSFFGTNIGVDLGTANTLISVDGKGIVLNEPSVIAKDTDRDVVLAVGQSAKDMLGKAPAHIRVVKPLEEGVISDFDMAADMLATFFKQMMGQRGKIKARVAIGVPSGVTEVEKRAVEEVVTNLGPKEVYILEEPMAAAIGAGMDVDGTTGCMIVDIGGGTTDIAIITLGGVVSSNSIRYAGDKFNDAVMQFVRRKYSLLIGTKTAEKLKKEVGCAMADLDENGNEIIYTAKASGRDIISGLPKTIDVTSRDLEEALAESVDVVVDGIKATIEKAPPEIAADVAENGLVLSGGSSLLRNLDKVITKRTGMQVTMAENPLEGVVLGAAKALEDVEKLKIYIKKSRR